MRKEFDFVGHRKLFLIISGCVIALGILFNILFGVNMDISFTGGTLLSYKMCIRDSSIGWEYGCVTS